MSLSSQRCPWCAAELPSDANAYLHGVAVHDVDDEDWTVSAISQRGIAPSWYDVIVDEPDDDERYEMWGDEHTFIMVAPFSDADEIAREAGAALAEARGRAELALTVAEIAARHAVDHGVPEAQVARLLGVTRMTVRSWLGKR